MTSNPKYDVNSQYDIRCTIYDAKSTIWRQTQNMTSNPQYDVICTIYDVKSATWRHMHNMTSNPDLIHNLRSHEIDVDAKWELTIIWKAQPSRWVIITLAFSLRPVSFSVVPSIRCTVSPVYPYSNVDPGWNRDPWKIRKIVNSFLFIYCLKLCTGYIIKY